MPSTESGALAAHYATTVGLLAVDPPLDLPLQRAVLDGVHLLAAEAPGVSYESIDDAGGRPGTWCIPQDERQGKVIVYFHGGGFVVQSIHSHRKVAAHLARESRCRVLVFDYRQAPEHQYPAQLDDVQSLFTWLYDRGYAPGDIALAGDSAGACLAFSSIARLRGAGVPLPAAILGFSPWFDLECNGPTLESNANVDVLVQRPLVEDMVAAYLGGNCAPDDPLANPLYADLTDFPPVYIAAGGHEALLDNAERFVDRAREAGVEVEFELQPEQQHVYVYMAGRAPEADETMASAGAWLAGRLGDSGAGNA